MRKHFLILMLFALLPFTTWAATGIAIGSYTYTRSADIVNLGDALPTVTINGSAPSSYGGVFDTNGNAVTTITEAGIYYRAVNFTDVSTPRTLYVPFYVAGQLNTVRVNSASTFADEMATDHAYDLYYKEHTWGDVWYQYGAEEADGVILYPGQTPVWPLPENPTTSDDYKTGAAYYPTTDEQKTNANTWYAGLIGNVNYGSKIKRSWNATGVSNPDNYVFSLATAATTEAWKVAVVYNGAQKYCWGETTIFGSQDGQKHYGLFSVKNQDPHQADIYNEFGVEPTAFDATKFKMFLHPAALELPSAILAPVAATTLSFDTTPHELLTGAGAAETGWSIKYAVGATAPAITAFVDAIPAATEPNNYKVWVAAVKGESYSIAPAVNVTLSAADISSGWTITFDNESRVYNGEVQKPAITLVKNTVTLPATAFVATWNQDPKNAGEYTVSIAADGIKTVNAPSNFTKKFSITKAPISLTMTTPDPASVTYGTAHPAWASTVSGFVTEAEKTALWDATKLSYEVKKGDVIYTEDVLPVGNYTVTPKYDGTFTNYTLNATTTNFAVNPKDLDGLTVSGLDAVTYNGAVQKAANVVVKKGNDIVPADQYTVKYFADASRTGDEAEVKNVGTYYVSIKSKDGANYTFDIEDKTYAISKAALIVVANDCQKVYDGTATVPATITYSFLGLQGTDTPAVVTLPTDMRDGANDVSSKDANKDPYAITTKPEAFNAANYTFVSSNNGKLTINRRNLTVAFVAASSTVKYEKEYGDADPNYNQVSTTGTNGTYATFAWKDSHLTITGAVDGELTGKNGIKNNLNVARSNAKVQAVGDYKDVLTITPSNNAVFNNYNVTATATHDFSITPATIYVSILEQSKEYDGQVASVTVTKDILVVSNLKNNETVDVLTTLPTATIVDADKAVKSYTIALSGAQAANYNIQHVNGRYTINKKALTFSIPAQTLQVGQDIEDLDETGFKVTGLVGTDNKDDIYELTVNPALVDANDKIAVGATTSENGIILAIKAGEEAAAAAANYTWGADVPTAKLVIPAAETLVLSDIEGIKNVENSDDPTTTTVVEKVSVTFTNREFKKGVWETLVLPFATSVRKISQALGYAVVDVLQESGNDMNFKLYMGEIPAYTPFLVKTDEDVNLNTVTFNAVETKALTDALKANLTKSNDSYNFIGQVEYAAVTSQWWAKGSLMTENHFEFNQYAAGSKCKAMRAYITAKEGVSAAPNIFVEEPDGSTTAITCISADGKAVTADGWYTLNGVKLNAAPTEKGVYIQNGKKVVIK